MSNETAANIADESMKKTMTVLMGTLFCIFFGLLYLAGTVSG